MSATWSVVVVVVVGGYAASWTALNYPDVSHVVSSSSSLFADSGGMEGLDGLLVWRWSPIQVYFLHKIFVMGPFLGLFDTFLSFQFWRCGVVVSVIGLINEVN